MTVDPMLRYEGDFSPALKDDLDLEAVQLQSEDRFLFGRIDGKTSVRELSALLGSAPIDVCRGLLRLEASAVIAGPAGVAPLSDAELDSLSTVDDATATEGSAPAARKVNQVHEADLIGVGRYGGFRFPREPLEEINDLPISLRKELIWCDRNPDIDPFRLFDVSPMARPEAIRKGVNNRLRLYHPDTYFEHELGTFAPVILRHASRLGKIAEVMLNDSSRNELRDRLKTEGTLHIEDDPEMIAERARVGVALKSRRLKKNPMFQRIAKAKEFFAEAMGQAEAKNFVKAYNSILMAQTFDPANPVYVEMEERFRNRASDERAERFVKAAEFNEGVGRWDRAAAGYVHAARAAEHRPDYWAKAAGMMLRVGEDLKAASDMAERALAADADNSTFLRVQMDIFDAAKMYAKAARVAERILQLDPTAADVAERLKKHRRSGTG
jgi:hypothetical protein